MEGVVLVVWLSGVLMYGPPGTGKTMMAKAVANATTASFISVVGSEFVQKYLGEVGRAGRQSRDQQQQDHGLSPD